MKSPFPGVDPYLEAQGFWPDFHARFITYLSDEIAGHLPTAYHASIGERVSLVSHQEHRLQTKTVIPDVAITGGGPSDYAASSTATLSEVQPTTIPHIIDAQEELRETYVEIVRRDDQSLVTVIELLSPSNKTEPGLSQYVQKQNLLLHEKVHLLELDLLLGGERRRFQKPLPPGHFYAMLSRVENRPNCDVYAWNLASRIPAVPVPLLAPDPDILVNLAAVFETTYGRGRYADIVRYDDKPELAVGAETLDWIADTARSQPKPK